MVNNNKDTFRLQNHSAVQYFKNNKCYSYAVKMLSHIGTYLVGTFERIASVPMFSHVQVPTFVVRLGIMVMTNILSTFVLDVTFESLFNFVFSNYFSMLCAFFNWIFVDTLFIVFAFLSGERRFKKYQLPIVLFTVAFTILKEP